MNAIEKKPAPPPGYWENGRGDLVPEASISVMDKLRDDLVKRCLERAKSQHAQMVVAKAWFNSEIDAFLDIAFSEHGEKPRSKKGNMTFYSFDKSLKIEVAVGEQVSFDEQIHIAKAKIDNCILRWGATAHPGLMTLIVDAFQVDKTGRIAPHRVMGLRRHNIDDAEWKEAMDLISSARDTRISKKYIRFYERIKDTEDYRHISLDMASA